MNDCCVTCGKETLYEASELPDLRFGYVEGLGQLCVSCYCIKKRTIDVSVELIRGTPNDAELGFKVRKLYNESGDLFSNFLF